MMYPALKLFILPGSQFCAKVLVALDSREIPYTLERVPFLSRAARARALPSGGHQVPELSIAVPEGAPEVIPDSTAILHRLDALMSASGAAAPLYEPEGVADADAHICSTINALVLYFNHVSDDGWARSMRAKFSTSLPPVVRNIVPYAALMSGMRKSMRERVRDELAVGEKDVNDDAMRRRLEYELARYESSLQDEDQCYLFDTPKPSAADCSLYAMLCRFVGTMGDAQLPPCLPDLWEKADGLANLQRWYQRMEKAHPFVWTRVEKK